MFLNNLEKIVKNLMKTTLFTSLIFVTTMLGNGDNPEVQFYNSQIINGPDGSISAGVHQVVFYALNLSSGLYYYIISADNFVDVR